MSFDTRDFYSDDPFVRYNAHQLAKGRAPLPDPDAFRKAERENSGDPGDEQPEDDAA